ncbi:EcsC family protein [Paenibacillus crassostreae]|uniref:ABC transporter-associated protein EcsC n=1 Tax=Paenibacillus crassostreae TaxID=1763538 RepID=A0A167F9U2_9BACL|nr:EcsC family protein [Paenibacillus crassostreae]AOZ90897.1 ABC transporter-associated protein EcsC [Paenibacillus crassostreae]OAB76337.1 ABC transporter-associated protein EcsC [Paenibacillus crassostreae]
MNYEHKVKREVANWEQQMFKPPGWLENTSKTIGKRINHLIPPKVHSIITTTIRSIVRTALFGAEYTPSRPVQRTLELESADQEAKELFALYQKIAVAEGAGTGAGGIMFSMVDFPALIAIKMKFLFELAHVYGYDTKHFSERVFILKVFQMTFSGSENRARLLDSIKHWHIEKEQWLSDTEYSRNMDWGIFQIEYRDAIDFRKMLQMVPGIGAFAGAWANYTILEELREFAMNAYRLRKLQDDFEVLG